MGVAPALTAEQLPQVSAENGLAAPAGESMDELEAVKDVLIPSSRTPAEKVRLGPPSLKQLTNPDQRLLDSFDDEESLLSPDQMGARYGERWWTRADEATREDLLHVARKPGLPRLMDGDLLKYASRFGITDRDDKQSRRELRSGFWWAVDDLSVRAKANEGPL